MRARGDINRGFSSLKSAIFAARVNRIYLVLKGKVLARRIRTAGADRTSGGDDNRRRGNLVVGTQSLTQAESDIRQRKLNSAFRTFPPGPAGSADSCAILRAASTLRLWLPPGPVETHPRTRKVLAALPGLESGFDSLGGFVQADAQTAHRKHEFLQVRDREAL